MPRPLPTYIEHIYVQVVTDHRSREWSVATIHEEAAQKIFELRGDHPTPSLPWAYKFVAEIRRRSPESDWLDEPWSMGALADPNVDIPDGAISDIIAVWNLCMIGGRVLTIRQAVWIARTRHLIPKFDSQVQDANIRFQVAAIYSIEEKTASVVGRPLNTSALDGEIYFWLQALKNPVDSHVYQWVRQLLRGLGNLPMDDPAFVASLPSDNTKAYLELRDQTSFMAWDTPIAEGKIQGGQLSEDSAPYATAGLTELSEIRVRAITLCLRIAAAIGSEKLGQPGFFVELADAIERNDLESLYESIGLEIEDE